MQNEDPTRGDSANCSSFSVQRSDFSFPRSHRLSGKLRFSAVYDAKVKHGRGPLVMYSLPNDLGHPRLGISISRHVGTAPRRNRIKRLIRESFRLHRWLLPIGYDLIVVVRPHAPMPLVEYQASFNALLTRSHAAWQSKQGGSSQG